MSTLKSVVITLPKGIVEPPNSVNTNNLSTNNSNLNFASSILATRNNNKMEARKTSVKQIENDIPMDSDFIKPDMWLRGKKRRLDHLTWEEKLQRKKLKNRVAAQTSRDRKKAKLDELEDTVRALRETNEFLTQECALLRSRNESLTVESKRLRRERDEAKTIATKDVELYCSMCQGRVGCAAPTSGSAVSLTNPLPQGGAAQPASSLTTLSSGATILLKIMTLYLLSRNSSENSKATTTSNDSKNWRKAFCAKLPQKWKQVLVDQTNRSRSNKIPLKNLTIQKEWWGRHQKMWKPVQPTKA